MLNHSALDTWGEKLQVTVGTITRPIKGVFVEAYGMAPVGNTDVERPGPSFSFRASDWNAIGASVGNTITRLGVNYRIISPPEFETGDWCNVPVVRY